MASLMQGEYGLAAESTITVVLVTIFLWRYVRQIVHLVAFWRYKPAEPMANPPLRGKDVTVLVPTIDPTNPYFRAGLLTALSNRPKKVIIITVASMLGTTKKTVFAIRQSKPKE